MHASKVCRYYGRPQAGLDSHFYSASASECRGVAQRFPDAWILESAELFDIVGSGKVRIKIGQRFPLADAAEAHRALEARKTTGSTVLTI